jgi:hypothetical protein
MVPASRVFNTSPKASMIASLSSSPILLRGVQRGRRRIVWAFRHRPAAASFGDGGGEVITDPHP